MLDTVPELYLYIYIVLFKDYGAAIFLFCHSSTGRISIGRVFDEIVLP